MVREFGQTCWTTMEYDDEEEESIKPHCNRPSSNVRGIRGQRINTNRNYNQNRDDRNNYRSDSNYNDYSDPPRRQGEDEYQRRGRSNFNRIDDDDTQREYGYRSRGVRPRVGRGCNYIDYNDRYDQSSRGGGHQTQYNDDDDSVNNRYSRRDRRGGRGSQTDSYDAGHTFDNPRSYREGEYDPVSFRGRDRGSHHDSDHDYAGRRPYRGSAHNAASTRSSYERNDFDQLTDDFSTKCDTNEERSFKSKTYQNSNQTTVDNDLDNEPLREPVTYIPPEFDESERSLFSRGVRTGVNFDKYDCIKVNVTGGGKDCKPIDTFNDLNLIPTLLDNVNRCNYTRPTPIQRYALPLLLSKSDLMACAQTGSGKTAAFVLPILNHILKNDLYASVDSESRIRCCHPIALVIVPTRELVLQTFAECKKFSFNTRVRTTQIYGGVSVQYQLRQLGNGSEIVVGTTGRLLDVIRRGALRLDCCSILILDEADRMLDMGFEPDVTEILNVGKIIPTGHDRCTAMFSATFPFEVQQLAKNFLCNNYSFITVGVVGGACENVEQTVISVNKTDKRNKLKEILGTLGERKTLIFVEQKRFTDFLASDLNQSGFKTTSIHGDRMQQEREEALRDFVSGKMPYLVATSVAARGLDISGVENVINYDLPDSITEYVHRIGRTGRCGNTGKSISFYDDGDDRCNRLASSLVAILKGANQPVPDFLDNDYNVSSYAASELEDHHTQKDFRGNPEFDQTKTPEPVAYVHRQEYGDDCWD
ncbi:hypothetical protein GJ496_001330 [Pomphorhynchus laevis]|nr:hypothetical protein GJ496_001330 [Pomphorhynchus laevis]